MRRLGGIALVCAAGFLCGSVFGVDKPAKRETPEDLVTAQLAAGEFGPAIKTAQSVKDVTQQTKLLRQVTQAQRDVGEHAAAQETAGLIPDPKERSRDRVQTVQNQAQAGGGTGANFQPLIQLITTTINPESWEDSGGDGRISQFVSGVHVDPNGQLRIASKEELTGRLTRIHSKARVADLSADMSRQSSLRLVSLPRLEAAVAERLAAGQPIPETMRRLAGLSRIQYVFVFPDSHDVVIAGPAEGWKYDDLGRPVGNETGNAAFDLDDLVVLLRTFNRKGNTTFGCSINTREANLKSVKEYAEASQAKGPLRPGQLGSWLKELQKRLGEQDVVVDGVPDNTRVAQVLVEADYRMKLIGIEKLNAGPNIPSYFALLPKLGQTGGGAMDALRWWLTMKYGAIDHSPDRMSFEIRGSSVLCQSEHQFVTTQGGHVASGATEPANLLFAQNFTRHYPELAKKEPVFADLQNIFDLAMAAAICREEGLYEVAGWMPTVFAPGGRYLPAIVQAPRVVDSVVNHRVYQGKNIVVQVAGGVQANIGEVARDKKLQKAAPALTAVHEKVEHAAIPPGRWWWDAR